MYGVCCSAEELCDLSFESPCVDVLFGIVSAIRRCDSNLPREKLEQFVAYAGRFLRFFQTSDDCSNCHQHLQPLSDSGCRIRPRLKRLLDCIAPLQELGVLNAEKER
jgi:hypothetical protein